MEDKNIYNFTLEVESEERIDKLLARHFLEYSRSTIQSWISEKNVKINNNICSQKDRIKSTCEVSIHISSTPEINLVGEDINIDVIDETNDYIVINKKSGMVTHIAPGNYNGTLQNALYYKYPELADVPRTGIIHRLDKDTSGVLVVARNLKSHNYLNTQLQNQKFEKIYHALISGIHDKELIIKEPISRHPVNRKKMFVSRKGKQAVSIIKPLSIFQKSTHVEIKIVTGRTHQIRVHAAFINRPVIGDKLYGFRKNIFSNNTSVLNSIDISFGQYLHAYSLSFCDPCTKKVRKFIANYPREYQLLIDRMRD